jgi:hypothetical protein
MKPNGTLLLSGGYLALLLEPFWHLIYDVISKVYNDDAELSRVRANTKRMSPTVQGHLGSDGI